MRNAWLAMQVIVGGLLVTVSSGYGANLPCNAASSIPGQQILFLSSYHLGLPIPDGIVRGMLEAVKEDNVSTSDLVYEEMDLIRYSSAEYRADRLQMLRHKLIGKNIGIIIAEGPPAIKFMVEEGKDLLPCVPLLTLIDPDNVASSVEGRKILTVPWKQDPGGTLEIAMKLFPETHRVLVVTGAKERVLPFLDDAKKAFAPWTDRLEFEYTNTLTYEEMLQRISSLPPASLIIYAPYFTDTTGRAFVPAEVVVEVNKLANAPIFGTLDAYLERGIIGGSLLNTEVIGQQVGRIALNFLNGQIELVDPVTRFDATMVMMVDWRELTRWGGDPVRIPASSIINRPVTLWSKYKLGITMTALVFLCLTGLIAILLGMNRRLARTKANLADSAQRYEATVQSASDAIISVDDQGLITFWNDAAKSIFGYAGDEILGRDVSGLIPGSWRSAHDQAFERAVKGGRLRSEGRPMELTAIAKDGREIPVEISMSMWRAGSLNFFTAIVRDITKRKQSELALRESENQYRSLVENQSELVCRFLPDTTLTFANDAFGRFYGKKPQELLGSRFADFLPIEVKKKTLAHLASFTPERPLQTNEQESIGMDGNAYWHIWNNHAFFDDSGRVVSFQAIGTDITDRKLADQQVALVLNASPVALAITSMSEGMVLYANPAAGKVFGVTADDLVGRTVADFYADPGVRKALVDGVRKDGEVHDFEAQVKRIDGTPFRMLLNSRSLDFQGQKALISGFTDITERIAMEHQLLQAQKMETVGQLTGGVAHDFNNLLQVVQSNLEMAKDSIPEGSRTEELVNGALRAGQRGAKLTQQLLAFSRKQTLSPESLDCHLLIDGMASLLARTLGEDISIKTKFADATANVVVDENGLTNALLNLALNARAAMPKGGSLTVAVGKRHFDSDIPIENEVLAAGDYFEISVTDTGCGISEKNLSHAFEPFFTTKEVGEGSGLGLSMVYGFARQSGGNVTIESELGKGTTVRLVLPAAIGEAASTNGEKTAQKDVNHAIKVLLVEDDADVRASTVMLLQSLGCEVVEAEDAAPVIDILRRDKSIDLLLSDVVLPGGKNGIELAHEAVARRLDLKVILVSGYSDGMLEKTGLKDAGFRLLGKPFSKSALSEALESVMAGKYCLARGLQKT